MKAAACSSVSAPSRFFVWEVKNASSWLKSISEATILRIIPSHRLRVPSNSSSESSENNSLYRNSSVISDSPKYCRLASPFSKPTMFLSAETVAISKRKHRKPKSTGIQFIYSIIRSPFRGLPVEALQRSKRVSNLHPSNKMASVLRRFRHFNTIICRSRRYSVSTRTDDFYDIVIVGGGMVGGSLACALGLESSLAEHKVLLLEAAPKKDFCLPNNYENRVSSITPGSRDLLERIGAWDHISDMRMKPYKRMQVWDACGDGHIAFDTAHDVSSKMDMAYIVENSVITQALNIQLQKLQQNIEVLHNARIKNISIPDPVWNVDEPNYNPWVGVQMNDGRTIKTRLLIGADGVKSTVRGAMDTEYLSWNYQQFGVVATLELAEITENLVAWQKFLPTGPMALLPLSEDMSSLVWTTTPEHAKTLVNLPEDSFVDAVNNGFWEDLKRNSLVESASNIGHLLSSLLQPTGSMSATQVPPSISKVVSGSRAMFPLALGHSTHYVQPRMALIGDAAHRIHPLAGQGVNLGFGDVISLLDKILQSVENGQDLGDITNLLEYETERQRAVVPMMIATDLLNRLFSTSSVLPTAVRTAGLLAVNAAIPVKDQIISFARR